VSVAGGRIITTRYEASIQPLLNPAFLTFPTVGNYQLNNKTTMNDDTIPVIWWDEDRSTTRSRARRDRLMPLTLLSELEPALIAAGIPWETVRELLNEVATLEGFGLAKGYRL